MPEYSQDNRYISIHTPLGPDVLLLRGFSGEEGVSRLFHFTLQVDSENRKIEFDSIVGKAATIRVVLDSGEDRFINGVISSFTQCGATPYLANYRAEVVPWLWLLTRTSDCRIFQNLSVPDILQKVFQDFGFSDFKNKLHRSYSPREYVVQYRETYFNFVSRLMEEEGIFYFFEHSEDKHVLVIADNPSEFKPQPLVTEAEYDPSATGEHLVEVITRFDINQQVRPGKYTINDFNFETPLLDLTSSADGQDARKYEIYDYPGEYPSKGEGENLVKLRVQEEDAPRIAVNADSMCRGVMPGYRLKVEGHFRRDLNKEYTILYVRHSAHQGENYLSSEADGPENFNYENSFECIPYPTPYCPLRLTPVPVVHGSQTAIVVGPSGEEIYVDKYGRVKVQFHWDREGKYNEKSSCWVRVSQNWAGKRWGAMFIPRIGQEVIVDFLEGNPNDPIISGRVYNGASMPPYALPDEMTKSTIKSYSSKGGAGFNEIRFEDKKGSEQVFFHAEKDEDFRVKNDRKEWIGQDSHLIVIRDQLEKVGGDKHLQIAGDQNEKIGGTLSISSGADHQEKVGSKYALDAGIEVHIKGGTNVVIEAGAALTLKVGGNFVNINPGGVFIKGTMVMINSGGAAGSGSGASPDTPKDPIEADKAEPGQRVEMPPPKRPGKPATYSPGAIVLQNAAADGVPFCEI